MRQSLLRFHLLLIVNKRKLIRVKKRKKKKRWLTLPKGKKDDGFNHEKFEHRAVGAEQVSGGKVEEEESVQGEADWDVVDDGHVQISAGHTVIKESEPV